MYISIRKEQTMPPKRRRARRAPRRTVRVVRIASAPVGGRRYGTRRRRRRVAGGNIFKKIWSGVRKAGRYIADNKLLSRGLSLIPHPTAQKAAGVARVVGLGPRGGRMRSAGVRVGDHIMIV